MRITIVDQGPARRLLAANRHARTSMRRADLDHLSAKIGQEQAQQRPSPHMSMIQHAESGKGRHCLVLGAICTTNQESGNLLRPAFSKRLKTRKRRLPKFRNIAEVRVSQVSSNPCCCWQLIT